MALIRLTLSIALILAWSISASANNENLRKKVIKFSTAIIPPYQSYGANNSLQGSAPSLVNCITNRLGFSSEIKVFPWARAQKSVKNKERDAFFVASQNIKRDSYAEKSAPLFSGTRSWYFRKEYTIQDTTSDSFKETAYVGTVFGTNMHSMLKENFKHVVSKTTEAELIELLKLGRLDALLLTKDMYKHVITTLDIPQDYFPTVTAAQKPLGVYFGHHFLKAHPNFLKKFNDNIEACKTENLK